MILDPVVQKMIDELAAEGVPPVYTLTPAEAREGLLRMQSRALSKPSARIRDLHVESHGQVLRLRIIHPETAAHRFPVVVYLHGGGWVLGDSTTHDRLIRELAVGAEAAVVFVEYDRAPECHYPVAIEEAYAATCYVTEHADALDIDATRLAVVGDSAG